mmetsp:Transcript_26047/g.52776  ORF Transcript_26047/g.52776 Transcript_26047/m.52776 type:complete len:568 (+) Transcript_26047:206-1909(+)
MIVKSKGMTPTDILQHTSWFSNVSDELKEAIASKMTLAEVEEGHVFVQEDFPINHLMIIEQGTLTRSKMEPDEPINGDVATDHRPMKSFFDISFSSPEALEESIVVDEIEGLGRVSGLLHILVEYDSLSFATVWAKTPARVWLIPADEFKAILASKAAFALEMMGVLAMSMRVGSKSLRGLIKNASAGGAAGTAAAHPHGGDVLGTTDHGDESVKRTIRCLCYDSTSWVTDSFKPAVKAYNDRASEDNAPNIIMEYTADRLSERSATYAAGYDAVCLFVNDTADCDVLRILSLVGVKMIAMRCAGFDRVDTRAAKAYGFTVARVPAYSPYAVAEHAISLLMTVNRKISIASTRVKMANFTLDTGLLGMDIHGKNVGVMGTGKIGQILCNILNGFGCNLLCYDVFENDEVKKLGATYVSKEEIFEKSDVLFLMMPLLPQTKHTINRDVLPKLKKGVIIINTARGGLIDTEALLSGLQTGIIGGCGLDVYEKEQQYFFQDWSAKNIEDSDLTELLGNNKVVLTAHQAFFTKEAIDKIVGTTIDNLRSWKDGKREVDHPNTCIQATPSKG